MLQTVFYIFAASAVVSAVLCILQKSPVASAMWLVSTMFSLAGIFLLLDAQFLAVTQVLIYAGAVMVLFLFVIMLLNVGHGPSDLRGPAGRIATLVIAALLIGELGGLWYYTPARLAVEVVGDGRPVDPGILFAGGQAAIEATARRGVVGGMAEPLFRDYLVPFEITSILLLAAIVGAVVLAKRKI